MMIPTLARSQQVDRQNTQLSAHDDFMAQISDPAGYRKSEWTRIPNPHNIRPEDIHPKLYKHNIYHISTSEGAWGYIHYLNGNGGQYQAIWGNGQGGPCRESLAGAAIDLINHGKETTKRPRPTPKPIKRNTRPPAYEQITYRPDPERYRVGRAIASIT
ncbi:MAG: hypothetical protein HC851_22035 [Acaryochloris sp. RU_4_1]|nr:hypothetical protein [Acaryochloris sp. RU_4_1]NJR55665.1 hypothetical protein [Acaryochloris sp. CRU_2_0]